MDWNIALEECIRTKDFEALTTEERNMVLSFLDREDYDHYRALAVAGKALGESPLPPPAIQHNLQQAFRKRYRRRNLPLSTIVMPLWQAAAVAALFLLLGKVITWAPVHASPNVAMQVHDSIWIERVSQAMKDTAVAILSPFDSSWQQEQQNPLALQDSIGAAAREEDTNDLLPTFAVDTPDWARRSSQIDQVYINHLYRLN